MVEKKYGILKRLLSFCLILTLLLGLFPAHTVAYEAGSNTVYVYYVDGTGSGTKDGSSAENAFQYLSEAYAAFSSLLDDADVAIVVITGVVSIVSDTGLTHPSNRVNEYAFPEHDGLAVITSVYGGEDYTGSGSIAFDEKFLHLFGNTQFENIVISSTLGSLLAGYHSIMLGEGIVSTASSRVAIRNVYGGTNSGVGLSAPVGDTLITIDSGMYTNVYGGGSSYQGTVTRTKNNNTQIQINGGTIENVYGTGSGNTDNAHQKNVYISMDGGTVTNIYGAHKEGTVYQDISIAINGGTVTGSIYGADKYTRPANGSNTSYTPTIYGDINIAVASGASVQSVVGAVADANTLGKKIVAFKNYGSSESYAEPDFTFSNADTLGLSSSYLMLGSTYADIWEGISGLQETDDSCLLLDFVPDSHIVNLWVTKTGEEYVFESVLVSAPYGAADIFSLQSPIIYELQYQAGNENEHAFWALLESALACGQPGADGMPLDVNLGLPESYDDDIDGDTTYERYLQRMDELGNVSVSANVISPALVQGEFELFVSPDGDDGNRGSIDEPLKTIQKALDCVEAIKESLDANGIVVYLREGTYLTTDTITLGEQYSGTDEAPFVISAYNGEEVKICGGTDIPPNAFAPVSEEATLSRLRDVAESHIVVADLSALGITDNGTILGGGTGGPTYHVYMNGEAMTLSRYPNASKLSLGQVLDIGPITANYSSFPQGTNANSTGIEFVMQDFRPLQWLNTGSIWLQGALYAEWDTRNIQVSQIRENTSSIKLDGGNALGAISGATHTYYYYNILEELDVPGEFYLDDETGLLYLYPICDMSQAEITFSTNQNDIIALSDTSNVVLNGLTIEYGSGNGIVMSDCYQTLIQNCTVQNITNTGVVIDGIRSGIIYSNIQYIGNYPVKILGSNDYFDYTPDNNFLQNCYIHNIGTQNPKYSYVTLNGVGNVISHNLIQGTFSVGIYNQLARECIVEYNEIVGGPNGTHDCAAIYCIGFPISRGNHYRYNYIHDIFITTEGSNPHAIYFDEMCSENYAYGNIMNNVPSGFFTNSGSENVTVNNIISNGRINSTACITGQSNFNNYTLPQWLARSSLCKSTMNTYNSMTAVQKEALRSRFPTLCDYYDDASEVLAEREELGDSYVITDTERSLVTAHDNYFAGNISYNHEGVIASGNNHITSPNLITSDDPFTDSAHGDYSLKEGVVTGFDYTSIQFANMGITGDKQSIGTFSQYAPENSSTGEVYCNDILLKWTSSAGADYYIVTLAYDESLTENVKTYKTEKPYCLIPNDDYFDYGETYYWSITAYSSAESRMCGSRESDKVFSFTSVTAEEYLAFNQVVTVKLEDAILKAQELYDSIVEGSNEGEYAEGTKSALGETIAATQELLETAGNLQDDIDAGTAALNSAIVAAIGAQNILYNTFDSISAENWLETTDAARASVTSGNDHVLMTVTGNRSEVVYQDAIGARQILCFDFYLETLQDWNGFALRQNNKDVFVTATASTDSYFICIKGDQFELQKRKGGTSYGNVQVLANNHAIMTSGIRYSIQLGALTQSDGGVRILFTVNGQTIFDYTDSVSPIIDTGYFGIVLQQSNGDTIVYNTEIGIEYARNVLDDLIIYASDLNETDYTTDSWAIFMEKLASAEAVASNENAVLNDYLNALNGLNTAMENLMSWETVNTEIAELPEVKDVTLQYKDQIYSAWFHYQNLALH